MLTESIRYTCETTEEWKGGMPIRYQGALKLLETAQVPPEHERLHRHQLLPRNESTRCDVIKNLKVFEGRPFACDGLSVKTCNELLPMHADLYIRQPNAELLLNTRLLTAAAVTA